MNLAHAQRTLRDTDYYLHTPKMVKKLTDGIRPSLLRNPDYARLEQMPMIGHPEGCHKPSIRVVSKSHAGTLGVLQPDGSIRYNGGKTRVHEKSFLMFAPCRQCELCIRDRNLANRKLLNKEARHWRYVAFISLTYRDGQPFHQGHIRQYMKRLQKILPKEKAYYWIREMQKNRRDQPHRGVHYHLVIYTNEYVSEHDIRWMREVHKGKYREVPRWPHAHTKGRIGVDIQVGYAKRSTRSKFTGMLKDANAQLWIARRHRTEYTLPELKQIESGKLLTPDGTRRCKPENASRKRMTKYPIRLDRTKVTIRQHDEHGQPSYQLRWKTFGDITAYAKRYGLTRQQFLRSRATRSHGIKVIPINTYVTKYVTGKDNHAELEATLEATQSFQREHPQTHSAEKSAYLGQDSTDLLEKMHHQVMTDVIKGDQNLIGILKEYKWDSRQITRLPRLHRYLKTLDGPVIFYKDDLPGRYFKLLERETKLDKMATL